MVSATAQDVKTFFATRRSVLAFGHGILPIQRPEADFGMGLSDFARSVFVKRQCLVQFAYLPSYGERLSANATAVLTPRPCVSLWIPPAWVHHDLVHELSGRHSEDRLLALPQLALRFSVAIAETRLPILGQPNRHVHDDDAGVPEMRQHVGEVHGRLDIPAIPIIQPHANPAGFAAIHPNVLDRALTHFSLLSLLSSPYPNCRRKRKSFA